VFVFMGVEVFVGCVCYELFVMGEKVCMWCDDMCDDLIY